MARRQSAAPAKILSFTLIAGCVLGWAACQRREIAESKARSHVEPVYDKRSGRLTLLKYASGADGRIDTYCYMDGPRVVRIEIDQHLSGRIDRWEYYTADQRLEKIGTSRANDGRPDTWSYLNPDGTVARIESSTRRDGSVDRVEYYERNVLVRTEEDTDGDGRIDKWATYDGTRMTTVAFDTTHRGRPDRRLVYGGDGSVRVESLR